MNESTRGFLRRIVPLVWIVRGAKWLVDPIYRASWRLRRASGGRIFQPWPTTHENRYPELFDFIAARVEGIATPRILSYGCATGEEVRALSARMPQAEILGIDPNPGAIAKAIAGDPGYQSRYIVADTPPPGECFDVILAMAVFRHGDLNARRPDSCRDVLPFARFAEGVARLDAALRSGGLLALGNCHFRLSDTELGGRYSVELRLQENPSPQALLYGPDDRRLDGVVEDAVLYRKA